MIVPRPNRSARPSRRTLAVALLILAGWACADDGGDGDRDATPDRTITVQAAEYSFASDVVPDIRVGETIRFVVENVGALVHEMQILDAEGRTIARTVEIPPGGTDEVVATFEAENVYQVICDVDDHLSQGQQALFPVTPPDEADER